MGVGGRTSEARLLELSRVVANDVVDEKPDTDAERERAIMDPKLAVDEDAISDTVGCSGAPLILVLGAGLDGPRSEVTDS